MFILNINLGGRQSFFYKNLFFLYDREIGLYILIS